MICFRTLTIEATVGDNNYRQEIADVDLENEIIVTVSWKNLQLSLVTRKLVFGVCDQTRVDSNQPA